eukprot:1177822-Prorocentrum_minimum.AAC.1
MHKAIKNLEMALQTWDGEPEEKAQAYNALGYAYFQQEKWEKATWLAGLGFQVRHNWILHHGPHSLAVLTDASVCYAILRYSSEIYAIPRKGVRIRTVDIMVNKSIKTPRARFLLSNRSTPKSTPPCTTGAAFHMSESGPTRTTPALANVPPRAVQEYKQAVELQPGYITAWNNLGNAYEKIKKPELALEAYQETLSCAPPPPENIQGTFKEHSRNIHNFPRLASDPH